MVLSRLLLLGALSLSVGAFAQERESDEGVEKESIEKEAAVASPVLKLLVPKKPISSGLFDRVLQAPEEAGLDKQREADSYVQRQKNKYQLFLDQINATYFRRAFLKGNNLQRQVIFLRDFFEDKLERLEKKYLHFCVHLNAEDLSEPSKDQFNFDFVGTYNGRLNGDPEAQMKYAYKKYQTYLFIYTFVHQFPLAKVSDNPILYSAFIKEIDKFLNVAQKIVAESNSSSARDVGITLKSNVYKKMPYQELNLFCRSICYCKVMIHCTYPIPGMTLPRISILKKVFHFTDLTSFCRAFKHFFRKHSSFSL